MKNVEVGLFLPVGKNGWVHSTNAPYTPGTYEHVLEVTKKAEDLGFDFILSPAIWRGRRGPSRHWMSALESMTTSAGLLQATSRIKIFATVHLTIFPPATVAKIVSTLDQIGPGRVGLNLVTGSSVLDLQHIGLWDDSLDHDARYQMGDEWVQLVKRFWSEESVTHKGKFFEATDARMGPRPSMTPTLVNAGVSGRGFQFAAENCDGAFLIVSDTPELIESAKAAKENARKYNQPDLKIYARFFLVPGATDAEAKAKLDHYNAGVDEIALADIAAGYELNKSMGGKVGIVDKVVGDTKPKPSAVAKGAMVGSYENLAQRVARVVVDADIDNVLFVVPDYIEDVKAIAANMLPHMQRYGITSQASRLNQAA